MEEKRKHERVSTLNLFSYVCLDESDNPIGEGMGRTLDISEGGLLIETRDKIEAKYIMLMALGFEDDLYDIKCEVIYCRRGESTMFESGMRFIEASDLMRKVISNLVENFKETIAK